MDQIPHEKIDCQYFQPKNKQTVLIQLQPPRTNRGSCNTNKKLQPPSQYICSVPFVDQPPNLFQIKPWLLPLFRLADHLLGTLAGLSSTRVSRRSCWEKRLNFSCWISCKWRVVQTMLTWCFGGKPQTPDSNEVGDSIIFILEIFWIQAKEPTKHCTVNINQPSKIQLSQQPVTRCPTVWVSTPSRVTLMGSFAFWMPLTKSKVTLEKCCGGIESRDRVCRKVVYCRFMMWLGWVKLFYIIWNVLSKNCILHHFHFMHVHLWLGIIGTSVFTKSMHHYQSGKPTDLLQT